MQAIIEQQTKPASEWIGGRVVQKVSPTELHARAQGRLAAALLAWADRTGPGRVGTEWEFRVTPPGEQTRSLVPDVAFLSYETIAYADDAAAQIPYAAPTAAFEILSPNDRAANVAEKIRVYRAAGTELVVVIDPQTRSAVLHDADGQSALEPSGMLEHRSLPDFKVALADIFAKPAFGG